MGEEDLSGRSRLAKNIGASYLSHFVFVIFGFILPRAIDDNIGQAALGIWDFGWSFVTYMNLTMIGIGGSVNRFVARYRAKQDVAALNQMVSTVIVIQLVIAVAVLMASLGLAYALPKILTGRLGGYESTATVVIAGLGTALAIEMAFDVWRGVISGCHRWDLHNGINAGGYFISSLAMLGVLWAGYGLEQLVLVYLTVTIATEIARFRVARKVCKEITINLGQCNRKDAVILAKFGVKNILLGAPAVITTQTVNMFVVAYLGPAALAVLARPVALIRHVSTLVNKFSFVLTPTAGSLQSQDKTEELRDFALQSARVGWLIAALPLTFLFVLGDVIVSVWMGAGYANWAICAALSVGYLLPISQSALLRVLVGLDAHGRVAKLGMIWSVVLLAVGCGIVTAMGWTVVRAAIVIAVSTIFGRGIIILVIGFRHLKIRFGEYIRLAMWPATRVTFVVGPLLWLIRAKTGFSPLMILIVSMLVTGVVALIFQRNDVVRLWKEIRK